MDGTIEVFECSTGRSDWHLKFSNVIVQTHTVTYKTPASALRTAKALAKRLNITVTRVTVDGVKQ